MLVEIYVPFGSLTGRGARARAQARMMELRAESKAASALVLAKQQAQVMYCIPAQPTAGQVAIVRYNPNRTNLVGAEEVYIRGGYNRWAD